METSCNHAIQQVRNITNWFVSKKNTANVACLDIKKAFDRVNIWKLILILQKKKINPCILDILEFWLNISSARVKWNNTLSNAVPLTAGVRQGGILSPLLFTIYIDSVLHELEQSKLGCFINSKCANSFLYADDLILLSIYVCDLQLLVNKCLVVFEDLDLQLN